MSMKPILPEEEPGALLRLLALKRYEVPPPGYFDGFACKVTARIAAARSAADRAWWEPLADVVRGRVAFAGVGGLLGGMLLVGFLGSGDAVSGAGGFASSGLEGMPVGAVRVVELAGSPKVGGREPALIAPYGGASSVTPLVEGTSPFSNRGWSAASVQPVSYTPLR